MDWSKKIQPESDHLNIKYNVRANDAGFHEGDLARLYNTVRRQKRSPKLQKPYVDETDWGVL